MDYYNIQNINYDKSDDNFKTMSIKEQEDFMHLIYDVVHIGVSVDSMKIRLELLSNKYGPNIMKNLLNSVMKDEKYSNDMVLPMKKCIYQYKNFQSDEEFFANKLKMIKLLKSYGADMIKITNNNIDLLLEEGFINDEIKKYITDTIH
jgi:hypothetical protein